MKRLPIFILLLFACFIAGAQTHVSFSLSGISTPITNRVVWVIPQSTPTVAGSSIVTGDRYTTNSGTGTFVISNMNVGLYLVQVKAPPTATEFKILITSTNLGYISASTIMAAGATATFPAGSVAWAAASSDSRYALAGTTGVAVAVGTNAVGATNGTVVTISGTGDALKAGQNNFTGSNFFAGNTTLSGLVNSNANSYLRGPGNTATLHLQGTTAGGQDVTLQSSPAGLAISAAMTVGAISAAGIVSATASYLFAGNAGGLTNLNWNNITNPPSFVQSSATNAFAVTNGEVTPFQYGALGGANDDTVAFSNALNSGFTVRVPEWTNYTCNNLFLSNNAKLVSYGAKISFKTGATGYLIDTGTATNFYIGGLRMSGGLQDTNVSYWPTTQGARSAIHTYVFTGGSTIENNTAEDFTDAGFRIGMTSTSPLQIGPVSTSQSYRQLATQFIGNRARACYVGYDGYGYDGNNVQEYMTILNSPANNCYYGARIACGNIYVANCLLTGNHIGIGVLNGGPNNAHGSMIGGSLNHNEISIHCQNIATGFLFNGVYIAGGGNYIWLEGSTGVVIQNGTIDCDYGLISGGGGTNIIRNNVFSTSWPPITNAVGTPTPIIYGNFQNLGTGTDPASVRGAFSIYGAYGQPTNFSGTVSRVMMLGSGNLATNVNSGAVPIDGDGTATTAAQIQALYAANAENVTNGFTPKLTLAMLKLNAPTNAVTVVNVGLDSLGNVSTNASPVGGGGGGDPANAWKTNGNTGLPAGSFMGTTDGTLLVLKMFNNVAMLVENPAFVATLLNISFGDSGNTNISTESGKGGNTVLNGTGNIISNCYESTIVGGDNNLVMGQQSATIVGGHFNHMRGNLNAYSSIVGGQFNTNIGQFNTILGGNSNTISSSWGTIAGGTGSYVTHQGVFMWSEPTAVTYPSLAANSAQFRASGGFFIHGGGLSVGGTTAASAGNVRATNKFELLGNVPSIVMSNASAANQSVTIVSNGPVFSTLYQGTNPPALANGALHGTNVFEIGVPGVPIAFGIETNGSVDIGTATITTATAATLNGNAIGLTNYGAKVLDSMIVPIGALMTNNEASPASAISCTNYGDMFSFADAVSNQVHCVLFMPPQWDAGTINVELQSLSTGTNASLGGQTNIVYGISAGTVTNYGLVTSITYGTEIWGTNHHGTNSYSPGKMVSTAVTVGGASVTSTNPVSFLIRRLGGQAGDTSTNSAAGLVGSIRINYLKYISNSVLPSATQ